MNMYEVPYLIRAIEARRHPGWEQARMVSLIIANALGAKIKQKDFAFYWEKEEETAPDISLMRKRLKELKNKT